MPSTSLNNNKQLFMQELKLSGYKVVENSGLTFVDFGDGKKYEVDFDKPAWLILAEIEQVKKKSEIRDYANGWANFYHKLYYEKTEENKNLNKWMASLKDLMHSVKEQLNPLLAKYNVEQAAEIANIDDRNKAIALSDDTKKYKKLYDRAGMDFRSNCLVAFDAALHGGNWETQSLLYDC